MFLICFSFSFLFKGDAFRLKEYPRYAIQEQKYRYNDDDVFRGINEQDYMNENERGKKAFLYKKVNYLKSSSFIQHREKEKKYK